MNGQPPGPSPTSWTMQTLGWLRVAAARASRSSRSARPGRPPDGRRQLQGDPASQARVLGQEHFPHAAFTELIENAITADRRRGRLRRACSPRRPPLPPRRRDDPFERVVGGRSYASSDSTSWRTSRSSPQARQARSRSGDARSTTASKISRARLQRSAVDSSRQSPAAKSNGRGHMREEIRHFRILQ